MRAIIDPYFVACHIGQDGDVVAHVEKLLQAYREYRAGDLSLLASDQLFASLSAAGLYPLKQSFDSMLAHSQIHHVSGADLARLALRFVEGALVLEDFFVDAQLASCSCGIQDVLVAGCSCHEGLDEAAESSLHSYAAARIVDAKDMTAFLLSNRSRDPSGTIGAEVEFAAVLTHKDELFEAVGESLRVDCAPSHDDFLQRVDPLFYLLEGHRDPGLISVAIQAAAAQRKGERVDRWIIGSSFLESVIDIGVTRNRSLATRFLRACSETVLGESLSDTHWLRSDVGPSSPQIVRSGAAAWRRDVDRDVHLHYWVRADGIPEFSVVVHHNTFDIPDPTA